MNAALEYLLKANLFLILFYACYWIWLRKHTFFRLNRAYLIVAVLLSLTLPLVELPADAAETLPVPVVAFSLPVVIQTAEQPTGPDWETIAYWVYGLVAGALFLRLLVQITGVGRLIKRSEQHDLDEYTLVLPADERVPTFSFFRYLVLCRRDAQTANTPIVAHELVHIRQRHSFDVLLLEIVQLFFWMNPVLILYKQTLQQVHEFLADAQAEDKHEYATFLIDYAFGVQPNTLTNGFFKPSLLKERIKMLQRRATSRWALGKYMLVLPLLLSLLAMTAAREQLTELVTPVSDEKGTVSGKVIDNDGQPLPGATLIVRNTTSGAQTDLQGRYELKNVPSDAKIVASFVGYVSQVKDVAGKKTLDFALQTKVDSLRPVVVVGYGSSTKPANPAPAKPEANTLSGKVESFSAIEQNPEFPGGLPALGAYLSKNIRYPAEARQNGTQGTVFVQFTVNLNGDIQGLRVKKGIGSGCDEEAVRVVSQMPRWTPGMQSGKPVMTQYVLPIQFTLEKDDKRSGRLMNNKANSPNVILSGSALSDPDKKPLFVVDGEKMAKTESLNASVKTADIQSINVLKGESATTLYGDEGKNGVIQVKTKQAAMGEQIQQAGRIDYDGKPPVYMLDDKTITREDFQKLNPKSLQSVEVDHTKSTYTIKATTKN
ncbi:M56 family metallopeptidase [Larkinella humicola]|uniref:TonB family protein n=1 Tax=Larkinella humicola TaxID=2607654 RepID=A0A5N1JGW4_9BACT|nr:M56 family metallopeptidase [Larkinella humicola]KAA9353737.1 TonB family protein [Larkinella humicola]